MSGGTSSLRERIRNATISVDEGYVGMFPEVRRGMVKRHGLGTRITHWTLFILVAIMAVTGLMIWTGWYGVLADPVWGGYYKVFGLHMWAAILVLPVGFILFPFYHIVVDGNRPWPNGEELRKLSHRRELLAIAGALVGLRKYIAEYHEARRSWNEDEGEWAAYHPMQEAFFYIQLGLLVGVTLTGFGLYEYITVQAPGWATTLGFLAGPLAYETLKQIHHFLLFAWVGAVAFHAYFPLLPGNWDMFKTMFTGTLYAYIVSGETEREEQ